MKNLLALLWRKIVRRFLGLSTGSPRPAAYTGSHAKIGQVQELEARLPPGDLLGSPVSAGLGLNPFFDPLTNLVAVVTDRRPETTSFTARLGEQPLPIGLLTERRLGDYWQAVPLVDQEKADLAFLDRHAATSIDYAADSGPWFGAGD
ncbi:MAG: hypothetical protein L0191_12420, partial [Acidobacteria bacterium]|nr:hypothetical protein [Acidobacteriota bacterium]